MAREGGKGRWQRRGEGGDGEGGTTGETAKKERKQEMARGRNAEELRLVTWERRVSSRDVAVVVEELAVAEEVSVCSDLQIYTQQ